MAIHPQREHAIRRCLEQGEPPPKVGAELGVDLSKPRLPAVVIALLYKLLWWAAVLVDIDDEELLFVGERARSRSMASSGCATGCRNRKR